MAITFQIGREERRINPDAKSSLKVIEELRLMGANDLAEAIAKRVRGGLSEIVDVSTEWPKLLRALDHVQNAEPGGWETGELTDESVSMWFEVRDWLLGIFDMGSDLYEVIPLKGGARFGFCSYSGEYGVGDRLVQPAEGAWRVVEVRSQPFGPSRDGGVLVAEHDPRDGR